MKRQNKKKTKQIKTPINIISVIGFLLSVISFFATLLGITSIVSGLISVVGFFEIKETGEKGKIFAILGIAISIITFIMGMISLFALMANR